MRKKSFILGCFASVLAIIYMLSIAGMDVHTCSHTGKTYVSLLSLSFSCEDIHPDDSEQECCCGCHHHHQHHNDAKGCCSDESFQLLFSGDDNQQTLELEVPVAVVYTAPHVVEVALALHCTPSRHLLGHCLHWHVPDILSLNCVMRA